MANENDLIYHESGFCLEIMEDKESLVMAKCDKTNKRQVWTWKKYVKKNQIIEEKLHISNSK